MARAAFRLPRRLFSALIVATILAVGTLHAQPGTTIITHGFQATASLPEWPEVLGEAIADRADASGVEAQVLQYQPLTGAWSLLSGAASFDAELILVIDWSEDSVWVPGFIDDRIGSVSGAADALYAALRDPQLPAAVLGGTLLEFSNGSPRPLHLIGHSRGTAVNSEIARRLVLAGYTIDHLTTLDPHPVADLADPMPRTWEGVDWADNYWRADGCDFDSGCFGFDFDGAPIDGAFDVEILALEALSFLDNRLAPCSLEHVLVHTWYHGTADLAANDDGDCSIERSDWYSSGGSDEGYFFGRHGGGAGARPCGPSGGCPDAGRVVPTAAPAIVNGDFEFGADQLAGWSWHGGGGDGEILSSGGESFLQLTPDTNSRTHNRFFLREDADELLLSTRVVTPDPTGIDTVELVLARDGASFFVGEVALPASMTGWLPATVSIPSSIPRGLSYTLEVRLSQALTPLVTVDVDDLDVSGLVGVPFIRGDCNGDGGFDVADAVITLDGLFGGGGPFDCDDACDANDDDQLNVADAVYTLEGLFVGGSNPPPPFPSCGISSMGPLTCADFVCP